MTSVRWGRPVWALQVLVVGLALHNFVMAELWQAGVRGGWLTLVAAWKEVLLALALVLVVVDRRRLPFDGVAADWLALGFGAFVLVYAVLPQGWLDGAATHRGVLYGARHDLVPVAAYFLGRGLAMTRRELRRLASTIVATATAVAAFGLVDVYAVPLSWWRDSGARGWFQHQLGFVYKGLSGLPENFVYNAGSGEVFRRLVSTFLSPLATSYLLVVALLVCAAWWTRSRPRGPGVAVWAGTVVLLFAALLWTHSRSSVLALALGLLVYAWCVRRDGPRAVVPVVVAAGVAVVLGTAFVKAYPHLGPKTSFTPSELHYQESHAVNAGPAVSGESDASLRSHWRSLKSGLRTVVHHPQGYGVGNAGSTAARTKVSILAGESTYTELGVETGLVGALVFVAWALVLFWSSRRVAGWIAASIAAVLALAVQTDVIGVPWLAYVLWALAGTTVLRNDL